MYYDPRIVCGEWLTEHCLICGSVNHLFIDVHDASAWECYFCQNRFWIDELGKETYIMFNGVNEDIADEHLAIGHHDIKYLLGHFEREN